MDDDFERYGYRVGGGRDERGRYWTAAICLNGHVATDGLEGSPALAGKFCKECGAKIISQCPSCGSRIRGHYHVPGVFMVDTYRPPNFCEDCGNVFPWLSEKLKIAQELTDELDVSEDDRSKLKQSLENIAHETPRTPWSVIQLKRLFAGVKGPVSEAIRKIVVDVSAEAVKKTLFP